MRAGELMASKKGKTKRQHYAHPTRVAGEGT